MTTDEQAIKALDEFYHTENDEYHSLLISSMKGALKVHEQSKWISVDDQLPKDGVDVLILQRNTNGTRIVKIDYVLNGEFNPYRNVTHWQYLPEFKE